MQSASDFGCTISLIFEDAFTNPANARTDGIKALAIIRARDREIIEKCREMVRVTPIYIPGDGEREPLQEGFNSILRDLG